MIIKDFVPRVFCSVGDTGVVWAVDQVDVVWRRQGARGDNVLGNKWQSVTGKLSMVGASVS